MNYLIQFDTTVAGIPCQIGVIDFDPGTPAYTKGHPDNWMEQDPGNCEYDVLDRRGRIAPWLSKKVTCSMHDEIVEQIQKQMEVNHE